jgi:hypothetical protein
MTSAPAWTAGARQEQTLTLLELYRDGCGAAGGIRGSIENTEMLWNTCAGFQTTPARGRSSGAPKNACVFRGRPNLVEPAWPSQGLRARSAFCDGGVFRSSDANWH